MKRSRCRYARAPAFFVLAFIPLLSSCTNAPALPSQLSQIPRDLENTLLETNGIYSDGWMAENATCSLRQPVDAKSLMIRGTVPKIGANDDFHTDLSLSVGGEQVAHQLLTSGDFEVTAPVIKGEGKRQVKIAFSQSQVLPSGDGRPVGARLTFVGFVQNPGVRDVVRSLGIELGSGWGALERFNNENFRWVENDAQVVIPTPKQAAATLSVLVAPGPGVGQGFVLKVLNSNSELVAAQFVPGRMRTRFVLPLQTGTRNEFRLHVDGGSKRIASDPRILNFRVFEIDLS